MPLADMSNPVAVIAKQAGVSFFLRGFERLEDFISMTRHPLAGEKRGAADSADRGGDTVLCKTHTLRSERIEVRRLDDGVPGAVERIEAPVIRVENHDIWFFRFRKCVPEQGHRGESRE